MLPRPGLEHAIRTALARSRAVVLTGPRQSGKTTLARVFLGLDSPRYFDLENPLEARRLDEPIDTLSHRRQPRLATPSDRQPCRSRPAAVRHSNCGTGDVALLEDTGALSWADLVGGRSGALARRFRTDGAALSRYADADADGSTAAALARQRCQAAGQVAQGVSVIAGCCTR